MVKRLSDVVGQEVSLDLGSKGVLRGKLVVKDVAKFIGFQGGFYPNREIRVMNKVYALVPENKNLWYNFGMACSPFDRKCTVNEQNQIIYTEDSSVA